MTVRSVLIFVTSFTQWYTLRLIAEALDSSGLVKPQIIIIDAEDALDVTQIRSSIPVSYLSDLSIQIPSTSKSNLKLTTTTSQPVRLGELDHRLRNSLLGKKTVKKILSKIPGFHLSQKCRQNIRENNIIKKEVRSLQRRKTYFRELLQHFDPLTVVVPGDRGLGGQPALLSACADLNITSIIPPVSFSCPTGILARTRTDKKYIASARFARRYPNQVWKDDRTGNAISFFPERDTRVLDRAGMLPQNPKVLGGGYSSLLLLDSELSKENAVDYGVNPEKIRITGISDTDRLYSVYKNKVKRKAELVDSYNLESEADLVIVNLPLFDDIGFSVEKEQTIHNQILREICANFNFVLLSAHPRMSREYQEILSKKYPLAVLEERLADVLPVADIYISDQTSSTIFWAILSEVPTISLNWLWYEAPYMVKNIVGVTVAESPEGFRQALEEYSSRELRATITDTFAKTKDRYGVFDGQSMNRIIESITQSETVLQKV